MDDNLEDARREGKGRAVQRQGYTSPKQRNMKEVVKAASKRNGRWESVEATEEVQLEEEIELIESGGGGYKMKGLA